MNDIIVRLLKNLTNRLEEKNNIRDLKSTDTQESQEKENIYKYSLVTQWLIAILVSILSLIIIISYWYEWLRLITHQMLDKNIYYKLLMVILGLIFNSILYIHIIARIRKKDVKIYSYLYMVYLPIIFFNSYIFSELKWWSWEKISIFELTFIIAVCIFPILTVIKNTFWWFEKWLFKKLYSISSLFGNEISSASWIAI